jgi:crotonobetainyl-CoA:carnitine CoA-transferase CaiB-like acyl-CoA transferase
MFEQVEIDGKPLKIPAIVPKLKSTPGKTTWPGPSLGSHNDEVFKDILGLEEQQLQSLREQKVI